MGVDPKRLPQRAAWLERLLPDMTDLASLSSTRSTGAPTPIDRARTFGKHVMIAGIDADNAVFLQRSI
jgi:hypothetical protein